MTIVLIRAIDFFKIAKASGHSVDDVIKAKLIISFSQDKTPARGKSAGGRS